MKAWLQSWRKGNSPLPPDILEGVVADSVRSIWKLQLPAWVAAKNATVQIFTAQTLAGAQEQRALLTRPNTPPYYLGALQSQLPETPLHTLFFELLKDRFLLGWVTPEIVGDLQFVDIERPEPDSQKWLEALKSSAVQNRVVFFPFAMPETKRWRQLVRVAIKTRQSLHQGAQSATARGSAWEKKFDPPIDFETRCIVVR